MYPIITLGSVHIYVFGIFIACAWIAFFYFLHRYSVRLGISKHIFTAIIPFTISLFLFGRIFYILTEWRTEKFLFFNLIEWESFWEFLREFFIADNYNLSLAGGIVGFLIVFLWKTRKNKKQRIAYMDVIVPSFFIAAIIGYIGALFGGQLYGIPFDSPISVSYYHKYSIVSFQKALFPLPLVYALLLAGCMYFWHKMRDMEVPTGYRGFLFLGIYWGFLFVLEFLNGSKDIFTGYIGINLVQVMGIIFIILAFRWIFRFLRS